MPRYKVEIEQKTKTVCVITERAEVVVEAEDAEDAEYIVDEMSYDDTITSWKMVKEEEEDYVSADDWESTILKVEEIPVPKFAPNQMMLIKEDGLEF